MKLSLKSKIAIAALTAIVSSGMTKAESLVTLSVEASTSGNAGTYSSVLASAPTSGLFYEVVAQFAAPGTTNSNTGTKSPNGTTDSIIALPTFTLTTSADSIFTSSALQNNFNTGSGNNAGTTGDSTLNVRAIEQGFTENADGQLVILSGLLTVGSSFTGITASTVLPVTASGSLKVAGSPVAVSTSESTTDPLIGYTALTTSAVPAPSVLASMSMVAALGAFGMVARSRKTYLA